MTDATREQLKKLGKRKPIHTAILTTPEYDRGFETGRKAGIEDALRTFDSFRTKIDIEYFIGMRKELEALKR